LPDLVPLGVLVAINALAGIVIIVCLPIVAVRLLRKLSQNSELDAIEPLQFAHPPWRALVSLLSVLAVFNIFVIFWCGIRDCLELLLIGNGLLPFLWLSARRSARKRLKLREKSPTP
jgi:hypothetical protein